MKRLLSLITLFWIASSATLKAQPDDYRAKSWRTVATAMPAEWYGTADAKAVAETVVQCQKTVGGWPKNKPYHHEFTSSEKAEFEQSKNEIGATIDNGSTTMEMRFLANVYSRQGGENFRESFLKGLNYLLEAQYNNGGWPQFYPVRESSSVAYSGDITFNDNAMINVMRVLEDVFKNDAQLTALQLSDELKEKARRSFDNGVECLLNTQIRVDGKPMVWCAQHHPQTLQPANARKYELASFSGSESVGIVDLLMDLKNPSPAVIAAVEGAVNWFESHKIEGIRLEKQTDAEGNKDLVVKSDPDATPLWARFYDLETERPFFCDRDGIKKNSLAEIGYERRNGYGWYTSSPSKILANYPKWKAKWVDKNNQK